MLQTILGIIFPIFAVVLIGYLYARRQAPDMAAANQINLDIFTPALIFAVLADGDFRLAEYQNLALAGLVVVLGSGLLSWPVGRLAGISSKTLLPPMMFTNSGNMGLPLAVLAFGEAALPAAMVLFLVENLLHFTLGNAMLEGRVHPLVLLKMPMLQATLLGILVNLGQLPIPTPAMEAIDLLGQVAIPLMLFSLGVRMREMSFGDWRWGLAVAIGCPAVGLLGAFAALWLIELPTDESRQLILFAALPPAVLNFLLAEKFGQEPQRVASMVLLGNLGSLVVIPLVLFFLL